MSVSEDSFRDFCYRCFKPKQTCICSLISPVNNQTRIRILQHPLERHHPIGTARFATLGLKNVELNTVYGDSNGSLETQPESGPNTGLLFPSEDAVALETVSGTERPDTLIVLDGTWYNAGKLYRENPWLKKVPHYKLTPAAPSRYRIRMEPSMDSISTLEAIVEALRILEPETDCTSLLRAFDTMIDRQIRYMQNSDGTQRRKRPRRRLKRCIPGVLIDNFENLVVVYGENIRTEDGQRWPASICALRMGDGATMEQFIQLPAHLAHHMTELSFGGIQDIHRQRAVSLTDFVRIWKNFRQADDVLCAWNKGTLQSFFRMPEFPKAPFLILKAAYGNIVKEKFGMLEEVMTEHALTPEPCHFGGRAMTRMGNAMAMARYLHEQGILDFCKFSAK
ncbi:MAG: DTW domain-containing protein [Deltaproteobacteria bacterium]|nr:DTW domain-containing protein [Deltaproteobacteria bacterium]